MSILLIDAGNSRLKWAQLRNRAPRDIHAQPWTGIDPAPLLLRSLRGAGPIEALFACNVAGAAVKRGLEATCRKLKIPQPVWVRSTRHWGALRNGYDEPWRLGADRWVALIGAQARYPGQALCLVSIGTALTVDFLDGRGAHRSGLIIPGPQLMSASLEARTAGIRRRARGASGAPRSAVITRNTRQALTQGATLACAALIERALGEVQPKLGAAPKLLLSGGALTEVAPLLRVAWQRYPEPVLAGLAVIARETGIE